MVRVKYRYLISIVSMGVSSGASRGVSHRPAYPGCLALSSPSSSVNSSSSSSGDAIIYRAIRRSMQTVHGTFGVGRLMARFRIIYWNPSSGLLIIRALRGLPAEQLISALTLITSVYDGAVERPAVIDVIHRSGTVRCCQKFIVDYYKTQLSGCISGVKETAIARAVAQRMINAKPPDLTFDFK
ncbi:ribonuclease P:MRP protein subunit POP5 [Echinococcus multilocularis]|uniref:Ribonuclease P/MRP protein subunit POP5 n=1 Tax=Echinococcus multilocularis TaxID=6211 RepID=A0A068YCC6_ECHMU|nr:ribonuclease P:MRP protein subunit POP5 [Echinococcus multilocularis]